MTLLYFVIRRLIAMLFILFGVAAVTFFLVRLAPGDPVAQQLGQHAGDVTAYKRIYHQMGLDQPLWHQYVTYVWNALHGNLGTSVFEIGTPVTTIIGQGLPVSRSRAGAAWPRSSLFWSACRSASWPPYAIIAWWRTI